MHRVEETTTRENRIVREQEIIEVDDSDIHPEIEVLKRELEDVMDQPRLETNSLVNMNENCNLESKAAISQQKVIPEGAQNEDIEVMDMKLEPENLDMPKYGGSETKRSSDKISWIRSIRSVAVRVTPPPLTANLTPKTLVDRKKKPIFRHKAQDLDEAMNNPHVKPRLSYGYMIAMALQVNMKKHSGIPPT